METDSIGLGRTIIPQINQNSIAEQVRLNGALVLRALRSRYGLTQSEMCERIDVKQSRLSKLENGKAILDSPDIAFIAAAFDINFESLFVGFIPTRRTEPIALADIRRRNEYIVPDRYGAEAGSRTLSILSARRALEAHVGVKKAHEWFETKKIPLEHLVFGDNQISIDLVADLLDELSRLGVKRDGMLKVHAYAPLSKHSATAPRFVNLYNFERAVCELVAIAPQMEVNWDYEILELSSNSLVIDCIPREHLLSIDINRGGIPYYKAGVLAENVPDFHKKHYLSGVKVGKNGRQIYQFSSH